FSDVDAKVRKEATQLCVQCYRYAGDGIRNFLTDLRDVQMAELDKLFASVETGAVPQKAPIAPPSGGPAPANKPAAAQQSQDMLFNIADETVIVGKLP